MGTLVLTNAKLLVDGYDLSGQYNSLTLDYGAEMLDNTTFSTGVTTRTSRGGLKTAQISGDAFWDSQSSGYDPLVFNILGVENQLVTLFPVQPIAGATGEGSGYGLPACIGSYEFGGSVGDLASANATFYASNKLSRAFVLREFLSTAISTGAVTGTAFNFASVPSGYTLFAGLHITDVPVGGSLVALVQNSSASGFGVATTRITHTTITAKDGTWTSLSGPTSTDMPWWRVQITSCGSGFKGLAWMGMEQTIY